MRRAVVASPKPARSRHCEWGASPRSRGNSVGATVRHRWTGRHGRSRRSTSQETFPGPRHPTLSPEKERSNGPSRDSAAAAHAARRHAGGGPGAEEAGSGHRDRHEDRNPRRAGGGHRDRHRRRRDRDPPLSHRRRGAPQRAGRGDSPLGVVRQDDQSQHPRREPEPGADPGGRRAREESHHRPGRPGRHRPRVDRADRDHPRAAVDHLRRRCHRRRGADHHQEGQWAAHRLRVTGSW